MSSADSTAASSPRGASFDLVVPEGGRNNDKCVANFVFGLYDGRVKEARRQVNLAMKDPNTAFRLQFIINKNILSKQKALKGDMAILPTCCNKFDLLGKDRLVELAVYCEEDLDESKLKLMHVDDLKILTDFGHALNRPCAIPSKVWGECKKDSKSRYLALGRRMQYLIFETKGDSKSVYVDVSYNDTGAFLRIIKKVKGKQMVIALKHVSGPEAKLTAPVPLTYHIEENEHDWKAKLHDEESGSDLLCWRVFEKAGQLDTLPKLLADERVGQVSAPVTTPKNKSANPMLALANEPHTDNNAGIFPASGRNRNGKRSYPIGAPVGAPPTAMPRTRRVSKRRRQIISLPYLSA